MSHLLDVLARIAVAAVLYVFASYSFEFLRNGIAAFKAIKKYIESPRNANVVFHDPIKFQFVPKADKWEKYPSGDNPHDYPANVVEQAKREHGIR